jgi:hypothetical protein
MAGTLTIDNYYGFGTHAVLRFNPVVLTRSHAPLSATADVTVLLIGFLELMRTLIRWRFRAGVRRWSSTASPLQSASWNCSMS